RFAVVVQSPHWDEDEKSWLTDEFVKMGDRAKPILREFILKRNEVNHALLAYRKIVANDEDYKALLKDALEVRPPSDHRSVQGKQELIAAISEFDHASYDDLILPYLHDHSDDVQCAAIAALATSPSEHVKTSLVELLKSEAHSARVLRSAADIVSKYKMNIPGDVNLSDVVKDDFTIESGHLVRINHPASA
ncbi:MAG TPA: HEAT repeat domain-containing protein, partial [Myxococcota bacterium]|nr:HEAT repeat domain-containing protein [Myxococcota bacterium]